MPSYGGSWVIQALGGCSFSLGEAAIEKRKEAGLLKPSILKPLVATIEKGLVLRKLGRLGEED
jgi:mRNA interferase MazF